MYVPCTNYKYIIYIIIYIIYILYYILYSWYFRIFFYYSFKGKNKFNV